MAVNDIKVYDEAAFGYPGDEVFAVLASATTIKQGEPVGKALGQVYALPLATNKPVVATDFIAGVAATTSTNTASANGTVRVTKLVDGISFLINPKVALATDQATYDALVGYRVLLDLTTGSYTLLVADGSTYGCVIMPLDVLKYPGKIRFTFRQGCNYLT